MFDKEAYLLAKIESSEKKTLLLKVAFFFLKIYLKETHIELIDDKFLYGTVD